MNGKYVGDRVIEYDGSQLSPLWCFRELGVSGDCVVAFRGPCDVKPELMVDQEDRRAGSVIRGSDMLHFIVEIFGLDLVSSILVQRLLVITAMEVIERSVSGVELKRSRDRIFARMESGSWGKLTVSIATVSAVSALVHLGLNVTTAGTPIETACLEQIGVDRPEDFALEVIQLMVEELNAVSTDSRKVRPVT